MRGSPSGDPVPVGLGLRRAHFLCRWCAVTGSGSAWKGWGRRWNGTSVLFFTAPLLQPRRFPGPRTKCPLCLEFALGAPRPRRDVNRVGLSSVRTRSPHVARVGIGSRKDIRGLRRCRQPTRPVLKHGPRSLTHARVRGSLETPWRNESEGPPGPRWDPGLSGPGAPPARLARSDGEVERERVR